MEAIRSAEETSRTFQVLHTERSQRYREWMRCKQERAIQERVRPPDTPPSAPLHPSLAQCECLLVPREVIGPCSFAYGVPLLAAPAWGE